MNDFPEIESRDQQEALVRELDAEREREEAHIRNQMWERAMKADQEIEDERDRERARDREQDEKIQRERNEKRDRERDEKRDRERDEKRDRERDVKRDRDELQAMREAERGAAVERGGERAEPR